jgi:hypothetical protein
VGNLVPISLGQRSNPARGSKQAGNARHINCFAEEVGPEGKAPWVITAIPGLDPFGTSMGSEGIREMLVIDDNTLLAVAGRSVYLWTPDGQRTIVGGIPTDGPVYGRINRRIPVQAGFVSDGYYAVYDSGAMREVQDPDLPPPTSLAYLDGYGVLPIANGRYMLTGIDDFTSIDGLDEGTCEANPDAIVRAHELEREMLFFGTATTESHQNTGDADFPFTRSQAIDVGCAAADSVCPVDMPDGKALAFVAHDHTVRLIRGYSTVVISTNEIEDKIRRLAEAGTIGGLRATSWSWGGRFFYSLSCPEWTRVYDAKTQGWHDRESYGLSRWRIGKVVRFAGKLIAADALTGQLYQMKDEAYAEGSDPLVMQIITPPVHAFPYRGRINTLYIDAASGAGINTTAAQDLDPVMLIDWSKDGGESWSAPEQVSLGRLGQNATRLRPIRRLGTFGEKGIVFRFRISAALKKLVIDAKIDFDQLQAA